MSFLIDPDVHYLNCAYMSPLPHSVEAAGRAGMARKQRPWTIRPADFFTRSRGGEGARSRTCSARRGASRSRCCRACRTAWRSSRATCRFRPGQHIVVAGEQFPSNVHPWRRLAGQRGGEVRTVAAPEARDGRGGGLERRAARRDRRAHGDAGDRPRALGRRHAIRPAAARRAGARGRRVGGHRWHAVGRRARLSVRRGAARCGDVRRLQVADGAVRHWRWAGSAMSCRTASRSRRPGPGVAAARTSAASPTTPTTTGPAAPASTSGSDPTSSRCRWRSRRCGW